MQDTLPVLLNPVFLPNLLLAQAYAVINPSLVTPVGFTSSQFNGSRAETSAAPTTGLQSVAEILVCCSIESVKGSCGEPQPLTFLYCSSSMP